VYGSERFLASPGQLAGAAAVALVLIALAFAVRPVTPPVRASWIPRPLALGLGVFVALRVYQVRSETWTGFVFGMAWLALPGVLLFWFARQRSWEPRHQLALVAAALGTYAWLGFVLTSLLAPGDVQRDETGAQQILITVVR
jgi:peptidoglycan/LPS O-acetylase OafA/YrhL